MARSISLLAVVFALTSWALIKDQTRAQDQTLRISASTSAEATLLAQAEPKPKPKTRKPPAGRIPNGWGKLGLSPEQKKNIYEIQGKYKVEIEELEKQIEDVKTKQLDDMEGVLTADQLSKLKAQTKSTKEKPDPENSETKPAQTPNSK
ncbi:MAG: hypothetical protein WD065_19790 [Planctomycetaceae bacterium]